MDIFTFFFTFFSVLSLLTKSSLASNCPVLRCGIDAPEIRYPFRIQTQPHQQASCGLPDFNLSCKNNKTVIQFPSYGELIVKSISYDTKRVQLIDPKSCVHEVFLNLNLSSTPLSYYYVLKQYTYINCSSKLASFQHVPCLSGSDHYVYMLEPSFTVPDSCSSLRTVAVPFAYTPYLSGNSFGLDLTWGSTVRKHKTAENFKVLSATLLLAVGLLCYAIIHRYKKVTEAEKQSIEADEESEGEKLMGEYEPLAPARRTELVV